MLRAKTSKYNIPQKLEEANLYPYFRTIDSQQDTVVKIDGRDVLMFGSNSYLGLTNHPLIKEATKNAIDKYGTGCAGSRFLNGTLDIHIELEEKLAEFVGKEAALVFSTGYQANLGILSSIPGRNDFILLDEKNHASILDGARLSFAKILKFSHNCMIDLEKKLRKLPFDALKLIVVDGVFSMEGDLSNIPEIILLSKKYNANLMIDDAHGIGVMGNLGKGTAEHFGLTNEVDIIMGTFSKSLASIGGYAASDKATINFLKHNARSLIFSASISPANAAAALASLNILESNPQRLDDLWSNTRYAYKLLKEHGFNLGPSESPIIPIIIGNSNLTFKLSKLLIEDNVFVNPIVSPAVSENGALIRFSLMATHTKSQIEEAVTKIHKNALLLKVIEHNFTMA